MTFDASGNLYVANTFSNDVLRYDIHGNASVFSTFGASASVGLAFDSHGTLFGAFGGAAQLLKFDTSGNHSVFAPMPDSCYSLACGPNDMLYAAGSYGEIYRIDPTGTMSTFVGSNLFGGTPSTGGLAVDSLGNVYSVNGTEVLKYDSQGNGSVFATVPYSHLGGIAIEPVPEPAAGVLCALGLAAILARQRFPLAKHRARLSINL